MVRLYECDACEHVQLVGVIENGLPAGFADPDARCEKCGEVGKFYFAPGAARQLRDSISGAINVALPPDSGTWGFLERFGETQE